MTITVTIESTQVTPKTVTFDFGQTGIVLSTNQGDVTNLTENQGTYTVTDASQDVTFKLDTSSASVGQNQAVKVMAQVGNGQAEELTAANDVYTLASAKITGNVTITVTIESTQTP